MGKRRRENLTWLCAAILAAAGCARSTVPLQSQLALSPPASGGGSSTGGDANTGSSGDPSAAGPISFSATKTEIAAGASTTLQWSVKGALQATLLPKASAGGTTLVSSAGQLVVSPATTTTYGLTAVTSLGIVAAKVTVWVNASSAGASSPSIVSITAPQQPPQVMGSSVVTIVASGVSKNGDNSVVSDCAGPGSTSTAGSPVTKTEAPAGDGSDNVVMTISLDRPSMQTKCSFLVTRPDGVGATPVVAEPFWAAEDLLLSITSPDQVDNSAGLFWYIPQFSAATLHAQAQAGDAPAPADTPVLIQFFQSPGAAAGGQALFTWDGAITTDSTDSTGTLAAPIAGCSLPGSEKTGASDIFVFIGNRVGEIYLPIAGTAVRSCP